jgi:uncharacterized membrane protein YagU involved in acid resistance
MQWLERIRSGLISGLIAGFAVLGIGGRLAMRLISIADGKPGRFTVGGTMFVLVIFSVFGLILSVPFATLQKYLKSSNLRKGATFGLLLMLAIVWVMPLLPLLADAQGDEINLSWIVARTLFSVLFFAYGVIVASVSERLDKIEAW